MGRSLKRKIMNEAELIQYLENAMRKKGVEFNVADFARMPFVEQVALVHRTDILVGYHGLD